MVIGPIHDGVQVLEIESAPRVVLPWSKCPVERVSYGSRRDIDGYSTSSRRPDYRLFTRPSIENPDRWQVKGSACLPATDGRHRLRRVLGRLRPRMIVFEMLIGETYPDEHDAMQAAESWLDRVLRRESREGEVRMTTL